MSSADRFPGHQLTCAIPPQSRVTFSTALGPFELGNYTTNQPPLVAAVESWKNGNSGRSRGKQDLLWSLLCFFIQTGGDSAGDF